MYATERLWDSGRSKEKIGCIPCPVFVTALASFERTTWRQRDSKRQGVVQRENRVYSMSCIRDSAGILWENDVYSLGGDDSMHSFYLTPLFLFYLFQTWFLADKTKSKLMLKLSLTRTRTSDCCPFFVFMFGELNWEGWKEKQKTVRLASKKAEIQGTGWMCTGVYFCQHLGNSFQFNSNRQF